MKSRDVIGASHSQSGRQDMVFEIKTDQKDTGTQVNNSITIFYMNVNDDVIADTVFGLPLINALFSRDFSVRDVKI